MFSPVELALIQGFPADYKLYHKRGRAYQQVGNAFPPPVMSLIVEAASDFAGPRGRVQRVP